MAASDADKSVFYVAPPPSASPRGGSAGTSPEESVDKLALVDRFVNMEEADKVALRGALRGMCEDDPVVALVWDPAVIAARGPAGATSASLTQDIMAQGAVEAVGAICTFINFKNVADVSRVRKWLYDNRNWAFGIPATTPGMAARPSAAAEIMLIHSVSASTSKVQWTTYPEFMWY